MAAHIDAGRLASRCLQYCANGVNRSQTPGSFHVSVSALIACAVDVVALIPDRHCATGTELVPEG